MHLVSFLIKMRVKSQQYQEQMSAGLHVCAESKRRNQNAYYLKLPCPVTLQYRLHCGPTKLPLKCCLEVMLN